MKKKMLFVTMAVLLLSLLIVGAASAAGWIWGWNGNCQTAPYTYKYHWASNDRIMVRDGICENGEFVEYDTQLWLNLEKFKAAKAWNYCEGALWVSVNTSYFDPGPYGFGGKPGVTWENGYIVCIFPAGHWD